MATVMMELLEVVIVMQVMEVAAVKVVEQWRNIMM